MGKRKVRHDRAMPVCDSVEAGDQQQIPVGEHISSQGTKCAPLEFVAESEDNDCKHGEICSEKRGKRLSEKKKLYFNRISFSSVAVT